MARRIPVYRYRHSDSYPGPTQLGFVLMTCDACFNGISAAFSQDDEISALRDEYEHKVDSVLLSLRSTNSSLTLPFIELQHKQAHALTMRFLGLFVRLAIPVTHERIFLHGEHPDFVEMLLLLLHFVRNFAVRQKMRSKPLSIWRRSDWEHYRRLEADSQQFHEFKLDVTWAMRWWTFCIPGWSMNVPNHEHVFLDELAMSQQRKLLRACRQLDEEMREDPTSTLKHHGWLERLAPLLLSQRRKLRSTWRILRWT